MAVHKLLDVTLESAIVPSFTRLGYQIRRRSGRWTPLDAYSLNHRVVLLTGGTSGLGYATATQLASCGASVIITGRTHTRNQAAADRIVSATGNPRISSLCADMGDLEQVRQLARQVLEADEPVDTIIHNAGTLSAHRQVTAQGLEATVASQVVGPFLLTSLLTDHLASRGGTRVLTMSSGGMYSAKLRVDDLEMLPGAYRGAAQYAQAKRAQVVLNELWAQRWAHAGLYFHSVHPGWVDTPGISEALPGFSRVLGPLLRTPAEGADTMVWLAADRAGVKANGLFWHDRCPRSTHRWPKTKASDTPNQRERLWNWVSRAASLPTAA